MSDVAAGRVRDSFVRSEGTSPSVVAVAPGRVNLIGDHVDYTGGLVMPIAIERNTAVALGPGPGGSSMIVDFLDLEDRSGVILEAGSAMDRTDLDYIRGPLMQLLQAGLEVPSLRLSVSSTVPMGAGLSSSAALQVAVLLGIRTYLDADTTPLEIALEARSSEHSIGTPCGLMDMYVSAAARANHACLIDCSTNELEQVPLPGEEDAVFIITDTGVRHDLRDGGYASRRSDCEEAAKALGHELLSEATIEELDSADLPDRLRRRARHVLTENHRVREFAEAMKRGELEAAGRRMFESHRSLKEDFDVSCPELDLIVEVAGSMSDQGVLGSRMTGGGFGGSTITMCDPGSESRFRSEVESAFESRFDRRPEFLRSSAADGASTT